MAAASFLLAGVWLALQVVAVGDAPAIVSRFETRASQRAAGSQFAYVAEEDLEGEGGRVARSPVGKMEGGNEGGPSVLSVVRNPILFIKQLQKGTLYNLPHTSVFLSSYSPLCSCSTMAEYR